MRRGAFLSSLKNVVGVQAHAVTAYTAAQLAIPNGLALNCKVKFFLLFFLVIHSWAYAVFVFQVAAQAVLFLCMNTAGIFISYLSDRAQRQAFLETRRCIEARLRLETENQRQVSANSKRWAPIQFSSLTNTKSVTPAHCCQGNCLNIKPSNRPN